MGWGAVAVVLLAVAVPVGAVLFRAVRVDGAWSTEALHRVLTSWRTWRVVGVTIGQAVVSCALTIAVGVPVAWVLARLRFPGRSVLRTLATVPFVLPTVVVGAAFASLLGPTGLVDARGTWWPILAAHLCFNLAVMIRVVGGALADLDPDLESAARLLGASPVAAARRVLVPAVAPALVSASVVVFLFCLTSFGVVVVLGGGAVTTVEVEIWVRATRQFDLSGAAVLATLQVLAVVATLAVHARLSRSAHRPRRVVGPTGRRPRGLGDWSAVGAAAAAVGIVSVAPMAALVERSLRVPGGHGVANWTDLGSAAAGTGLAVSPLDAVVVSLVTATTAAIVAVLLAVPSARVAARRPGGAADRILLLPLGVSATTIGLGLLLATGRPPVDLRRSWWLVPAAQALVAVPLVVRVVAPALRDLPGSVSDAAAVLGADHRARWWRVELPMVRAAVVAGGGLALVACLGEFGATAFLARADRPTVPVAVERLLSRPGPTGFGQAMALSCVLVVLCGVVLAVVDRWGGGRRGDGVRLGL